jgi:hypothetical protein
VRLPLLYRRRSGHGSLRVVERESIVRTTSPGIYNAAGLPLTLHEINLLSVRWLDIMVMLMTE